MNKSNPLNLKPKSIKVDMNKIGFQRLIGGPPSSIRIKSGMVSLNPGESVGEHNTDNKEELIIVMDGKGKMVFEGYDSVSLSKGANAYCPPHVKHNIINTGDQILRYIYVVSLLDQ